MKKNNFLYIGVFLVLFFSLGMGVDAATELSCLYEKSINEDKVMLVQQTDGTIKIYKNRKNVGFDDEGWYVSKATPRWGEPNGKLDLKEWFGNNDSIIPNGSLTECPKSMRTLNFNIGVNKGRIRFYDTENGGNRKLEDSDDTVIIPLLKYDGDTSFGVTTNIECKNISTADKWITPYEEDGDYKTSCLYAKDIYDRDLNLKKNFSGCHIIQINVDKSNGLHYEQSEPFDFNGFNLNKNFDLDNQSFNTTTIKESFSGECPHMIYVYRTLFLDDEVMTYNLDTKISLDPNLGERYIRADSAGYNLSTGEKLDGDVSLNFKKINITDCKQLFDGNEDLIDMINIIKNIVFKVLIPILLIGFGTLDFVKVVFAGKEDTMKKAQSTFIKRLVIAVVIFLLPLALKIILSIANGIWGNIDPTFCGIL